MEGSVELNEIDVGDFPLGGQIVTTAEPAYFPQGNLTHGLLGFDLMGDVYTVIDTASDRVYFRPFPRHH